MATSTNSNGDASNSDSANPDDQIDGAVTPPNAESRTIKSHIEKFAHRILQTLSATKSYAVLWCKRLKASRWDAMRASIKLGATIHSTESNREDFSQPIAAIDELDKALGDIRDTTAHSILKRLVAAPNVLSLTVKRRVLLYRLGSQVCKARKPDDDPDDPSLREVRDCLTRVEELDHEMTRENSRDDGLLVRPSRCLSYGIAICAVVLLAVWTLGSPERLEDKIIGRWTLQDIDWQDDAEPNPIPFQAEVEYKADGTFAHTFNTPFGGGTRSGTWSVEKVSKDTLWIGEEEKHASGLARASQNGSEGKQKVARITFGDNNTLLVSPEDDSAGMNLLRFAASTGPKMAATQWVSPSTKDKHAKKKTSEADEEAFKTFVAEIEARKDKPVRWIVETEYDDGKRTHWQKYEERLVDVAFKINTAIRHGIITEYPSSDILVKVERATYGYNSEYVSGSFVELFDSEHKALAASMIGDVTREKTIKHWNWEDGKWVSATAGDTPTWPFSSKHEHADMDPNSFEAKSLDIVSIRKLDANTPRRLAPNRDTQSNKSTPRELALIFNLESQYSDIQREKKEKEITGQVVEWTVPVFVVKKRGDGYRIMTATSSESVGAFVTVTPRDKDEFTFLASLKEGDLISFKGRISGVTITRRIVIEAAVLVSSDSGAVKSDFDDNATKSAFDLPVKPGAGRPGKSDFKKE